MLVPPENESWPPPRLDQETYDRCKAKAKALRDQAIHSAIRGLLKRLAGLVRWR